MYVIYKILHPFVHTLVRHQILGKPSWPHFLLLHWWAIDNLRRLDKFRYYWLHNLVTICFLIPHWPPLLGHLYSPLLQNLNIFGPQGKDWLKGVNLKLCEMIKCFNLFNGVLIIIHQLTCVELDFKTCLRKTAIWFQMDENLITSCCYYIAVLGISG